MPAEGQTVKERRREMKRTNPDYNENHGPISPEQLRGGKLLIHSIRVRSVPVGTAPPSCSSIAQQAKKPVLTTGSSILRPLKPPNVRLAYFSFLLLRLMSCPRARW
jgi:hypothetical protein